MGNSSVEIGGFYQHYNNERVYEVLDLISHHDDDPKLDGKVIVEYRDAVTEKKSTRFKDNFTADITTDAGVVKRFQYVGDDKKKLAVPLHEPPSDKKPKEEML